MGAEGGEAGGSDRAGTGAVIPTVRTGDSITRSTADGRIRHPSGGRTQDYPARGKPVQSVARDPEVPAPVVTLAACGAEPSGPPRARQPLRGSLRCAPAGMPAHAYGPVAATAMRS